MDARIRAREMAEKKACAAANAQKQAESEAMDRAKCAEEEKAKEELNNAKAKLKSAQDNLSSAQNKCSAASKCDCKDGDKKHNHEKDDKAEKAAADKHAAHKAEKEAAEKAAADKHAAHKAEKDAAQKAADKAAASKSAAAAKTDTKAAAKKAAAEKVAAKTEAKADAKKAATPAPKASGHEHKSSIPGCDVCKTECDACSDSKI